VAADLGQANDFTAVTVIKGVIILDVPIYL
jgi:hypothetical protein